MAGHRYRMSRTPAINPTTGALSGSAKLYFWESGASSVAQDTYSDAGQSSANANPVVANSAGFFDSDIFLQFKPYRVELKDSSDNLLWREDPVYPSAVRLYLSALPSVNWEGLEVVDTGTSELNERNIADSAWNNRGNADTAINAASVSEALAGTSTAKVLTPDAGYGVWGKGDNLTPSAGTVTLDSDGGGVFNVAAGDFSAISSAVGGRAVLFIFGGASIITHNATSLILPGGANITTEAGDCALFVNDAARDASGSNWRCVWFQRDSTTLGPPLDYAASQAEMETGSTNIRWVTPGRAHYHQSAAKCWAYVTVSGGAPTLASSYNITSITDTGTGRLTITIANDFSSANWSYSCSSEQPAAGTEGITNIRNATVAAGTVEVTTTALGGADADPASYSFQGFGDI